MNPVGDLLIVLFFGGQDLKKDDKRILEAAVVELVLAADQRTALYVNGAVYAMKIPPNQQYSLTILISIPQKQTQHKEIQWQRKGDGQRR